ncbi:hypothetical protein, partial [Mesorhizobium sp. M1A.T.Ca.IN.004.03.1.1]|uniref:hypothetical protein n=1 Tax=Mesorhizobium sp. M1A.T.Ca.IN.004.03.1.1 TaxID=2496795 RepID=UPI0019D093C9
RFDHCLNDLSCAKRVAETPSRAAARVDPTRVDMSDAFPYAVAAITTTPLVPPFRQPAIGCRFRVVPRGYWHCRQSLI